MREFSGRPVFVYFLFIIAFLIPFKWLLAPMIILLGIAVFFFQSHSNSIDNLKQRPLFILFASTYILYVLGMLYTENISFGLRDLEYKLGLLVLPVIIAAAPKVKRTDLYLVLQIFILACVLSSVYCLFHALVANGFSYVPLYTELSAFQHPSYFSLYINFCLLSLFLCFFTKGQRRIQLILLFVLTFYLLGFNLLLNSKMGILLSFVIVSVFAIRYLKKRSGYLPYLYLLVMGVIFSLLINFSPGLKERFKYLKTALTSTEIERDIDESSMIRILIWEQAVEILKEKPLLGVGTGDSKDAFMHKYESNGISYAYENKLNAHNQYFEWLVTFGLLGLTFWLFSIVYPAIIAIRKDKKLYTTFILLILFSFTVESMLETEAGLIFFSFFNSLLFFHTPSEKVKNKVINTGI